MVSLTPLIKQLTEAAPSAKPRLSSGFGCGSQSQKRPPKTIKAPTNLRAGNPTRSYGNLEPSTGEEASHHAVRRDRARFGPPVRAGNELPISAEIEDLYAFSVSSTATISAITDKVIPELKQCSSARWRRFIPSSGWTPFTMRKVREDGRYQNKAVYTVLALNPKAKEVLVLSVRK